MPPPRATDTLRLRLVSSVVFLPVLLYLVWLGGLAYIMLVSAIVVLGLVEFYEMLRAKGERPYRVTGTCAALLMIGSAYFREGIHANVLLTAVLLGLMATELFRRDNRGALHNIAGTVFGVFYVGWLGSHLVLLREFPGTHAVVAGRHVGSSAVYYLLLTAWGCDTGAYLIGKRLGRHRLLPRVSPSKSVEGAVGGLCMGALLGWVGAATFARFLAPWAGALIGALVAVTGQIGDMVESLLKRDTARKDSAVAMVIPGHGGVLDRFDSVLFAAPVFYYVLRAIYF